MQTSQIFSKNQSLFRLIKVSFTHNRCFFCQEGVIFLLVSDIRSAARCFEMIYRKLNNGLRTEKHQALTGLTLIAFKPLALISSS